MIGRGIFSFDDHLNFGKFVDELSRYCYTVMYIPRKDLIVVSLRGKDFAELVKRFRDRIVEVKFSRGRTMAFVKLRWR